MKSMKLTLTNNFENLFFSVSPVAKYGTYTHFTLCLSYSSSH